MRVVVCLKQIADTSSEIMLNEDGVISAQEKELTIDPFCDIALAAAVDLPFCEGEESDEIMAITIASVEAEVMLRYALSMGAQTATIIQSSETNTDPFVKAAFLAKAINDFQPDLILGGCRSTDTAHAQVLSCIAEELGYPYLSDVIGLELGQDAIDVTCSFKDGIETVRLGLPAVIGVARGLAEPGYPVLKEIMAAKHKPLKKFTMNDFAITDEQLFAMKKVKTVEYRLAPPKEKVKYFEGDTAEVATKVVDVLRLQLGAV